MSITGPLRDALRRGDTRLDVDALAVRVAALDRFTQLVADHVPAEVLARARAIVEHAGGRLANAGGHTVVALAGATGSGKSSLFNAASGLDLSAVGVRRPTTAVAHACVWQGPGGAERDDWMGLLDWLGVPSDRRFVRESVLDADDEATLRGLVLLDLPDFDSIHSSHRVEVDRLLALVDLVVWVTDPQKYADQVIHERYLRIFHRHTSSMAVVLNQADRLRDADVARCLTDLQRLLAADGLADIELFAVSATAPRPGTAALRTTLERAVTDRLAALRRLGADVDGAVAELAPLIGPAIDEQAVDRSAERDLATAFGDSAGVPAVAEAAGQAYRVRATRWTGWPPLRWVRRRRPDPLRRVPAGRASATGPATPPGAAPAERSTATLAIRALADRAGTGLPPSWPPAVAAAARSRTSELPDALDRAVVGTDLGVDRTPVWWRLVGVLQWLLLLVAIGGGGWLLVRVVQRALGRQEVRMVDIHGVQFGYLLLGGGLVAGIVVALLARPLVAKGAKRASVRAGERLRVAVTEIAGDYVIAPVRQVLSDYGQARRSLGEASGR